MRASLREGGKIGRYELLLPLARGGMSDVWLARETGNVMTVNTVVIKIPLPELAADQEFQEMFRDEANLAARLDHPNIARVLHHDIDGARHFLVMEHIVGRTLRHIVRECRRMHAVVPPWFALQAASSVCDALAYAHALCDEDGNPLSIVHRDVTPENILVTYGGHTKVIDFGVAKAADAVARTRAGALKGKYPYMAPELIEESEQGLPPTPAVDLYALGVVLYELITGDRPFRADNELALIRKITTTVPDPPASSCPWLSESLSALVMRAIARSPDDRFTSAGEMKKAIEDYFLVGGRLPTLRNMADYVRALFPVPIDSGAFPSDAPPCTTPRHSSGPKDPWQDDSQRESGVPGGVGIDLSASDANYDSMRPGSTCPPPGGVWTATAIPPLPPVPAMAGSEALGDEAPAHGWDAAVSRITRAPARGDSSDGVRVTASDWFDAGLERWRDKDFDGTLDCWTRALQLDPENRRYQSNLRKLEERMNDRGKDR